jgi:hypothetical protein
MSSVKRILGLFRRRRSRVVNLSDQQREAHDHIQGSRSPCKIKPKLLVQYIRNKPDCEIIFMDMDGREYQQLIRDLEMWENEGGALPLERDEGSDHE